MGKTELIDRIANWRGVRRVGHSVTELSGWSLADLKRVWGVIEEMSADPHIVMMDGDYQEFWETAPAIKPSTSRQTIPDGFSLATSPLSNSRLNVLAFLTIGPWTTGDIAETCGFSSKQAWIIVTDFEQLGWVQSLPRRRWGVTDAGRAELSRFLDIFSNLPPLRKQISGQTDSANVCIG